MPCHAESSERDLSQHGDKGPDLYKNLISFNKAVKVYHFHFMAMSVDPCREVRSWKPEFTPGPYSPVYMQLLGLLSRPNFHSPSGCRLFREANWVMGPLHSFPLCSNPTLSPPNRPHPPLGRRTISASLQAEVEQQHRCGGSVWSALHEVCVGAAELLLNLYNKKCIAFFGASVWEGVFVLWDRQYAGLVFGNILCSLLSTVYTI